MKNLRMKPASVTHLLLFILLSLFASCQSNYVYLTPIEIQSVKEDVTQLTGNIAKDVTSKGPAAWLNYFEDSPDFFMASDGELAFKDYPSARAFVLNTLVKSIPQIKLSWTNLRVDPLTNKYAAIGANYNEMLTDSTGKTSALKGYFTATAHLTAAGWKIKNLHWSMKQKK